MFHVTCMTSCNICITICTIATYMYKDKELQRKLLDIRGNQHKFE